jgi:hypothetical protein
MSYSRTYSYRATGTVSESVNYPASEHGGSTYVSIPYSHTVYVDLLVDTAPFDHSVDRLRGHLDGLTASVVGTEAAHVTAKRERAEKVANCLTSGFFTLIRSEISQQTVVLRSRIDSLMLKLRDMRSACERVQQTMQADFSRITERYVKIFDELDREMHSRASAIDADAMTVRGQVSGRVDSVTNSRLCTQATLSSAEGSQAQTKLLAGAVRSHSQGLLLNATAYLRQEKSISLAMNAMLSDPAVAVQEMLCVPVLIMVADGKENAPVQQCISAHDKNMRINIDQASLKRMMLDATLPWTALSAGARSQIDRHFNSCVDGIKGENSETESRVRRMILQLWHAQEPQALPY